MEKRVKQNEQNEQNVRKKARNGTWRRSESNKRLEEKET